VIVHPLRQLMQFSGGGAQRIGAIAPHVRNNFVVDIGRKTAQILFQMRRGLSKLLFPLSLRLVVWHARTSPPSIR
jgi:hypothetical protein